MFSQMSEYAHMLCWTLEQYWRMVEKLAKNFFWGLHDNIAILGSERAVDQSIWVVLKNHTHGIKCTIFVQKRGKWKQNKKNYFHFFSHSLVYAGVLKPLVKIKWLIISKLFFAVVTYRSSYYQCNTYRVPRYISQTSACIDVSLMFITSRMLTRFVNS